MELAHSATAFATECSPLLNKIMARGTSLPDLENRVVRLRQDIDTDPGSQHLSDVERFDLLWELACSLCARYDLVFDITDLDESILILQQIVDFTVAKLGRLPSSTIVPLGKPSNKIEFHQGPGGKVVNAANRTQPIDVDFLKAWADWHNTERCLQGVLLLCSCHKQRRKVVCNSEDVPNFICMAQNAYQLLSDGHPLEPHALRVAGDAYFMRHGQTGNKNDLDLSLSCHRRAASLCHLRGHACGSCIACLAESLDNVYSRTRVDRKVLVEAQCLASTAKTLTDESAHSFRAYVTILQAMVHKELALLSGNLANLDSWVEELSNVKSYLHSGNPLRGDVLWTLAFVINAGDPQDAQPHNAWRGTVSLEYYRDALRIRPLGHPMRAQTFLDIAMTLWKRHANSGNDSDLYEAEKMTNEAFSSTSKLSNTWPNVLRLHAVVQHTLFDATGDFKRLENAVHIYREALTDGRLSSMMIDSVKNNIGYALLELYNYSGEKAQLDEAINLLHSVFDAWPLGHPRSNHAITSLCGALINRYDDFGDARDIEESISLYNLWHTYSGSLGSGFRKDMLREHTKALLRRLKLSPTEWSCDMYQYDLVLEELRETLELFSGQAGTQEEAFVMLDLGNAHIARFPQSHEIADVNGALDIFRRVEQSFPEDLRIQALLSFGFAAVFLAESLHQNAILGVQYLHRGLLNIHCHPQVRLQEAANTLKHIGATDGLLRSAECVSLLLQAYHYAIQLLPRIAFIGLHPQAKLRVLAKLENLTFAASLLATRTNNLTKAIEFLEQGRVIFWSQHCRLREPLQGMPDKLGQELRDIAMQLKRGSNQEPSQQGASIGNLLNNNSVLESYDAKMRRLSERFEQLVTEARQDPQYERLLQTPVLDILLRAGHGSSVVVFLASESECCAIWIASGTPTPVPVVHKYNICPAHLSALASGGLRRCAIGRKSLERRAFMMIGTGKGQKSSTFHQLWNVVMKPVIDALGIKMASGSDRPRLFVCSTGVFAHLPLHAAGNNIEACHNYCVISYTPTLTALVRAHQSRQFVLKKDALVLVAAVSRPFKGQRLYAVEHEAECITNILSSSNLQVLSTTERTPPDALATAEALRKQLPLATIAHFACHGEQDKTDPLESGFLMADRKLTVSDLMQLDLKPAFLAILSACETAKGDAKQPDQAIHLAATLLYAGFPSVVATMWSMNDADGPLIAETVYRALFESDGDYLDPEVVPYALDAAVVKLRQRGYHPSRWAPYIHIGA